ncbi:MAG TPA: hypothetical protein VGM03_18855 [Phycisphaerae bacterium]
MNQRHSHPDMQICRYLDGELSPDESRAFEQRLAGDARLRAEVEAYRRTDACLQQWSQRRGAVPQLKWDEFARRIINACARATDFSPADGMDAQSRLPWYAPPRIIRLFGPSLAAAAAIAAILAGRAWLHAPSPAPTPIARVTLAVASQPAEREPIIRISFAQVSPATAAAAPLARAAQSIAIATVGAAPLADRPSPESSSWF